MPRPESPFEAASYDLNRFRERRMAERRAVARSGSERRLQLVQGVDRRTPPQLVLPPANE